MADTTDSLPNKIKPFRPRFSLLTLLLLMTIVAMGIALWQAGNELVPLRKEVRELRDELGILRIDEPEKIYAIRVKTNDDLLYRFRVYLPKGGRYHFNYAYRDIPVEGVPASSGSSLIEPGEYLIHLRKKDRRDPKTDLPTRYATMNVEYELIEGQDSARVHSTIGVSGDWVFNKEIQSSSYSVRTIAKQSATFQVNDKVCLIRFRESRPVNVKRGPKKEMRSYGFDTIEEPCDGFMIWIDQKP